MANSCGRELSETRKVAETRDSGRASAKAGGRPQKGATGLSVFHDSSGLT